MWCDVVWCGVVWCGVVWCGVVWCGVVWCGVVWCGVVWCGVVWCGVVWCGVVWCGVVWCGVVWCDVVLVMRILMESASDDRDDVWCGDECNGMSDVRSSENDKMNYEKNFFKVRKQLCHHHRQRNSDQSSTNKFRKHRDVTSHFQPIKGRQRG